MTRPSCTQRLHNIQPAMRKSMLTIEQSNKWRLCKGTSGFISKWHHSMETIFNITLWGAIMLAPLWRQSNRSPVDSPHKGPAMENFDWFFVTSLKKTCWTNNWSVYDLRHCNGLLITLYYYYGDQWVVLFWWWFKIVTIFAIDTEECHKFTHIIHVWTHWKLNSEYNMKYIETACQGPLECMLILDSKTILIFCIQEVLMSQGWGSQWVPVFR